jgi:hypothetical protein
VIAIIIQVNLAVQMYLSQVLTYSSKFAEDSAYLSIFAEVSTRHVQDCHINHLSTEYALEMKYLNARDIA